MEGVGEYLLNDQHSIENRQWSEAFVATIVSSIMRNLELSYLAPNNVETNYTKYYQTLYESIYKIETNIDIMNATKKLTPT